MRRIKLFAAVLGFLLAALGITLDNRYLVWAAMIVLATALALRLWLKRQQDRAAALESTAGD